MESHNGKPPGWAMWMLGFFSVIVLSMTAAWMSNTNNKIEQLQAEMAALRLQDSKNEKQVDTNSQNISIMREHMITLFRDVLGRDITKYMSEDK